MPKLFFLYHELRPEPSRYSYVTTCATFDQHCALFRGLEQAQDNGGLKPAISFDDGNTSDHRYALPALQRAGLAAHFFITAGWTGVRAGFMDAAELRELAQAGMTVGAHGWSHKLLTACSDDELRIELVQAKEQLEQVLGQPVPTMSLPGGRANRRVLEACARAGYTAVFTSSPQASAVAPRGTPALIGRLNLLGDTTTSFLTEVLQPQTGRLARLQRADRLKSAAKAVLGDRTYARVWRLANRHEDETADLEVRS